MALDRARGKFSGVCRARTIVVLVLGLLIGWIGMSGSYSLSPGNFLNRCARVLAGPLLAILYRADSEKVQEIVKGYAIGAPELAYSSSRDSWVELQHTVPGFRLIETLESSEHPNAIPFVYQRSDADYLRSFRARFGLDKIIEGALDEYDAMLRLGGWLGARWDHGTDEVPGGNLVCNPAAVIEAGERGAKYWCEIAAKTAVQAATALGWTARLTTASRDGYTWEHAVAELWSNQFDKWFALDTDFNLVYEAGGIPLSAFELSRDGERLQRENKLALRMVAPPKASLPFQDLVPFYAYVHIDMRNDWCTRPLRRGSPAGGDMATWWTARPTLNRILTKRVRVDDPAAFDWSVNSTAIHAVSARRPDEGQLIVQIGFSGYSPAFERFEVQVDGKGWERVEAMGYSLSVGDGIHTIEGRLVTSSGGRGPISRVRFEAKQGNPAERGSGGNTATKRLHATRSAGLSERQSTSDDVGVRLTWNSMPKSMLVQFR